MYDDYGIFWGYVVIFRTEKQLGGLIRTARRNKGWRQIDVARKASTSQKAISNLETGAFSSRLDTVLKVLAALDLDLTLTDRRRPSFDPSEY